MLGNLFVVSGPSGVGKGTVVALLLKTIPGIKKSVSVTTRKPRPTEKEGIDYFFTSKEEFIQMTKRGDLMEWAEFADNFYGTPLKWVEETLKNGIDIILEIELQGAKQIHKHNTNACLIFLSPPSLESLEHRLRNRATESADKVAWRLNKAKEELSEKHIFQYEVVNDNIEQAVKNIENIVYSRRVNDNFPQVPSPKAQ